MKKAAVFGGSTKPGVAIVNQLIKKVILCTSLIQLRLQKVLS